MNKLWTFSVNATKSQIGLAWTLEPQRLCSLITADRHYLLLLLL